MTSRRKSSHQALAHPIKPTRRVALASRFLVGHTFLTYLFLYAPIVVLIVLSFNAAKESAGWTGFSIRWYGELMQDEGLIKGAKNSLIIASAATVISTVFGTMAAIALSRFSFRGQSATSALLYLPIVIPEIVLAVALLTLFGSLAIDLSRTTVIFAHVVFTISYAAILVKARLAGLDRSVEEAARDLGAGPIGAFFRVTLPRLWPGILAAGLLVFTISLDDYVITSLVSDLGSQTLPVKVYSMLRQPVTPKINAACAVLLAATVMMTLAAQWLLSKGRK